MSRKIPLFKIYWDEEDVKMVNETIRRGMFWAIGPNIEKFEGMLAKYVGTKYALVFNSGTSALHAAMVAHDIGPGDEVIVPSLTFIATANAALFVGAKPVFADIEKKIYGLDPEDVERKITRKTRAIMPVHYAGLPCRIQELKEVAHRHRLILIEDAAEALGARIGDKKVGTFGDSAIFSFCQNKTITTGEGGAVVTDSKDIYERLKLVRSHGRLETANYFSSSGYMDYITLGYNFRMSDLTAALGVSQLEKIDKIIELRREKARYLTKKLAALSDMIILPSSPRDFFHVYQMYTIAVRVKGKRDNLLKYLARKGIMAKVCFPAVHLADFYTRELGHKRGELPITEKVCGQILSLPMYPTLTDAEIDYIAETIAKFFKGQKE